MPRQHKQKNRQSVSMGTTRVPISTSVGLDIWVLSQHLDSIGPISGQSLHVGKLQIICPKYQLGTWHEVCQSVTPPGPKGMGSLALSCSHGTEMIMAARLLS